METYDVIVIGAGSGGCAAAIRSADLGKRVALIEKRKADGVGGTCINRGCIPAKALLKSAEVLEQIKKAKDYGIEVDGARPNLKKIMGKKKKIVSQMVFGLKTFILKPRSIELIHGDARLKDPHTVEVTQGDNLQTIAGDHLVIATGSEPAEIPAFSIDHTNVITSDEALSLKEIPESLLVIGAGAIGLEFAIFYNSLGTKVTVVEMLETVAPTLQDQEMSELARTILTKKGIDIKTGVGIQDIDVVEDGRVRSTLANGETLETEKVLVGIGRKLNTDSLGLEEIGLKMERGRIVRDEYMRTNISHIYAVGDITDGPQLSHKAQNEGVTAAENLAGNPLVLDYNVLPWVIFSHPEIAKVGLSEAEAQAQGIETLVGKLAMNANEKANCMQQTEGMIKLTVDAGTRQIIGAIIIAVEAGTLIGEMAMAVKNKMLIDDFSTTIHAHPTLNEGLMEAGKTAIGTAYHT